MRKDPNEWTNLAGEKEFDLVKRKMAACVPKHDEPLRAPYAFPNRLRGRATDEN